MSFQPSVRTTLLWDRAITHIVAGQCCHAGVLLHGSAAGGRLFHIVTLQDAGHELWILHNDASPCSVGYLPAHGGEEL